MSNWIDIKEKKPNKGDKVVLRVTYPPHATIDNKELIEEHASTWNDVPDNLFPLSCIFSPFITHWRLTND